MLGSRLIDELTDGRAARETNEVELDVQKCSCYKEHWVEITKQRQDMNKRSSTDSDGASGDAHSLGVHVEGDEARDEIRHIRRDLGGLEHDSVALQRRGA